MRHLRRATLVTVLAFATGCIEAPSGPQGPVTLTFSTPTYAGVGATTVSAHGTLVLDGRDTIAIPGDSLVGVQRGNHSLSALLNIAYIPTTMTGTLDPMGASEQIHVPLPAACRVYALDTRYCGANSAVQWRAHPRTWCPTSDFGDFCSSFPDPYRLGLA